MLQTMQELDSDLPNGTDWQSHEILLLQVFEQVNAIERKYQTIVLTELKLGDKPDDVAVLMNWRVFRRRVTPSGNTGGGTVRHLTEVKTRILNLILISSILVVLVVIVHDLDGRFIVMCRKMLKHCYLVHGLICKSASQYQILRME